MISNDLDHSSRRDPGREIDTTQSAEDEPLVVDIPWWTRKWKSITIVGARPAERAADESVTVGFADESGPVVLPFTARAARQIPSLQMGTIRTGSGDILPTATDTPVATLSGAYRVDVAVRVPHEARHGRLVALTNPPRTPR